MLEIIIIGNSGAARECHQLLLDCIFTSPTLRFSMKFAGFLSHEGFSGNLGNLNQFLIGDTRDWTPTPQQRFILGVGSPLLRQEIFLKMKARNAVFMNLISPWSYVPVEFAMGEGNIINSTCNFSCDGSIGDANYFNGNVRLGHDVKIGSFNFFAPSTTVLGGASVGDCNLVAIGSVLLESCRIGNKNHVQPGSIIYKGCRNNCRMAGNPALKIESLSHEKNI